MKKHEPFRSSVRCLPHVGGDEWGAAKSRLRLSLRRILRVCAAALALVALPFGHAQWEYQDPEPLRKEYCNKGWAKGTAAQSCGVPTGTLRSLSIKEYPTHWHCQITVDCKGCKVQPRRNSFEGSPNDLAQLSDCNGTLKAGRCS